MKLWTKEKILFALGMVVMVGWATTIGNYYGDTTFGFKFINAQVVDVRGVKYLRLHRTMKQVLVGGFYVNMYGNNHSCSHTKPHDLLEIRPQPFNTRFISRFDPKCVSQAKPGTYTITITYAVHGTIFAKSFETVLTAKDLGK